MSSTIFDKLLNPESLSETQQLRDEIQELREEISELRKDISLASSIILVGQDVVRAFYQLSNSSR